MELNINLSPAHAEVKSTPQTIVTGNGDKIEMTVRAHMTHTWPTLPLIVVPAERTPLMWFIDGLIVALLIANLWMAR